MLALVVLAGLGLWFWLGKKKRAKIPAAWLGVAGSLVGAALMAKGMPVVGAVVAAASGLWLQYGGRLFPPASAAGQATPPPPSSLQLSRADAAELLGVAPDASRDEIVAAHRRLMARNHPDAGGSVGLAARINAARDLLLK